MRRRRRTLPNGDVIDLTERRMQKLMEQPMRDFDRIRTGIYVFLRRIGFPEPYADVAASDLAEGWINDDVVPLWLHPAFESPHPDDIREFLERHGLRLTPTGHIVRR